VIAFQAEVAGLSGQITAIGISHLESQADRMSRYGTDATAFVDLLTKNWGDVYQVDFEDHLQPLDTEIPCLISLVVARNDGTAKKDGIDSFNAIKRQCSEKPVNVKCFATDGDNGYEGLHLESLNRILR
jgi:hypothetical protein